MEDNSDIENSQQDSFGSIKSWTSSRFSRVGLGNVIKKRCLAKGCQQEYSDTTSTVVLKRHWKRKHDDETPIKDTEYTFHDEEHIDALIKMVILTQTEYTLVDQPSFKKFAKCMNPKKRLVCRKTISRLIEDGSDTHRDSIRQTLADEVAISLTFDIWSPKKGAPGYGIVTGHFITAEWRVRSLILEFQLMPHPHDGPTIYEFIKNVIIDMNIEDKVVAITTDNGSNVVAGVRLLVQDPTLSAKFPSIAFTHFRCLGHVIHLAVKQATKPLEGLITDAKTFVSAIRSSSKRNQAFNKCQQNLIDIKDPEFNEKAPLELIDDIKSRWNYSYLMIQRLLRLKKPIQDIFLTMRDLKDLNGIDWSLMEELESFLKPLNSLTNKFSGEKYCTISAVSSLIPLVTTCLDRDFHNPTIKKAADELMKKLSEYKEYINKTVILAANMLDPRFKGAGLSQEAVIQASQFIREAIDCEPNVSLDSSGTDADEPDLFDSIYQCETGDELQTYLAAPIEKKMSDIMTSWRANSAAFPRLAKLARQVLPIQATSTASERQFSIAGKTLTEIRNKLHPENFRSNVLNKSWIEFLDSSD